MNNKIFVFLPLITLLNACSIHYSQVEYFPDLAALQLCTKFFTKAEKLVVSAAVADNETTRIPGYPYLRINRFLSSYRQEVYGKRFSNWVDQLQLLAVQGWLIEIKNLPTKAQQQLQNSLRNKIFTDLSLAATLQKCTDIKRKAELDKTTEREKLRKSALVPASYTMWQRVVGLYPLTALLFKAGIDRWHQKTLQTYSLPVQQLPVYGKLFQYIPEHSTTPLSAYEISVVLKKSAVNALNIPIPDTLERKQLFDSFAPIFEIDVVSENDRIGSPIWNGGDLPVIDISKPTVYRHLSHTRVKDQVLLQLNYTIWFQSRPRNSAIDLLSGYLDGITWRVTLLPNGEPWLFDTIHNCGCYHLFFPTQNAKPIAHRSFLSEAAFTPQKPLPSHYSDRVILRIAANTHYIQRVYFAPASTHRTHFYQWAEASILRSMLQLDGTRNSLFGKDGIINGSERGERFLFWPMGIDSPGAMRQWGNHATAFVGRRHFDDARLFETIFELSEK